MYGSWDFTEEGPFLPWFYDLLGFLFSKSSTGYIVKSSVAEAGSKTVAISQMSHTTVY